MLGVRGNSRFSAWCIPKYEKTSVVTPDGTLEYILYMTKPQGYIFSFDPLCAVPTSPGAPIASLATLCTQAAPARKTNQSWGIAARFRTTKTKIDLGTGRVPYEIPTLFKSK